VRAELRIRRALLDHLLEQSDGSVEALQGLGRSAELADHPRQVAVDCREVAGVFEVRRVFVDQLLTERERFAVLGIRGGRR
jgi:hypothetical protein